MTRSPLSMTAAADLYSESRMSQKKALLIGISYEESEENGTLDGPHKGVLELRKLLIEQYGFLDRDIVTMQDHRDVPTHLKPTLDNMLREIDGLVAGAQAGDRFFFAYSGHSGQVENRRNSEEDGKDELIISSDGRDLIDNELKAHLVDPLPLGSSLVAFLDTCHSGSLLDLKHHRCNRVFTPRTSKGCRRTNMRWNANVRRLAINMPMEPTAFEGLCRSRPPRPRDMVTTDRFWRCHNHDGMNFCEKESRTRTSSTDTILAPCRFCNQMPVESRSWPLKGVDLMPTISSIKFPIVRCESPTAIWECEGDCRDKYTQTTEAAHVVCISACKDEQRAWEGPGGSSITMELVQILKENPHPSLKDLMLQLTHQTHERCLQVHEFTRQYKLGSRTESFYGEMDNFQDPQVASHVPLNMDKPFTI